MDGIATPRRHCHEEAEDRRRHAETLKQQLDYADVSHPSADAVASEPEQQVIEQGIAKEDEVEEAAATIEQAPSPAADQTAVPEAQDVAQPPPGADLDQWVRESANPQERAQRARHVAELKVAQRQAGDKARLAIFKSAPGSAASSSLRDGHRGTRSVPRQGNPKRGDVIGTAFKSGPQKSSTRERSM